MLVRSSVVEQDYGQACSAHVVVVGNEKGGSGKSTTSMHIAVALLKAGQRVATIDLDGRQGSFSHYFENRRAWAKRANLNLELPKHFRVSGGDSMRIDENEAAEFSSFAAAITSAAEISSPFASRATALPVSTVSDLIVAGASTSRFACRATASCKAVRM